MAILRCLIQHPVRKMSFQMQITGIKPVQLGLEEMTLACSGCSSTWVPLGGGAGLFARVFAAAVLSWLVSTAVGGDSDQEEGRWRLAAQNTTNHTYTHIYRGITCDWNAAGMLVWDVMYMENVALCWYDEFYITLKILFVYCIVLRWNPQDLFIVPYHDVVFVLYQMFPWIRNIHHNTLTCQHHGPAALLLLRRRAFPCEGCSWLSLVWHHVGRRGRTWPGCGPPSPPDHSRWELWLPGRPAGAAAAGLTRLHRKKSDTRSVDRLTREHEVVCSCRLEQAVPAHWFPL